MICLRRVRWLCVTVFAVRLLATGRVAIGEEVRPSPDSSSSAFHLPDTLRLSPVIPPSARDAAPPIHGMINNTPLANLPPTRAEHDGLVALGGWLTLGVVVVLGAWWLVQQAGRAGRGYKPLPQGRTGK